MTVNTWGDAWRTLWVLLSEPLCGSPLAYFILGLCSGWVVVGALGFVGFVLLFSWEDPDAGKG